MCEVKVNMALGTHKTKFYKKGNSQLLYIYMQREREREAYCPKGFVSTKMSIP